MNFQGRWINEPQDHREDADLVEITTDPGTDFWQRSYYGFRNDNAHAYLTEKRENFTFTAQVAFEYRGRFDQCGLAIYADSENWFKASIEHEPDGPARLGSVVTNNGYSDWATTDIGTVGSIWYRLSRRGPDFLIEQSSDGRVFAQMRVFHMHYLGETTPEMGSADPPIQTGIPCRFGFYACSPLDSSFTARFSRFSIGPCLWRAHAE